MKRIGMLIVALLSIQSVWASSGYEALVEGTAGLYCRRDPGLYDQISDDEVTLSAIRWSQPTDLIYQQGLPSVVYIKSSVKGRERVPGTGRLELSYVTQKGEFGYRHAGPNRTHMSELVCNF